MAKNEFAINNNTSDFPSMLNDVPISEEEEVSYVVESLFTNIPIKTP